MEERPSGKRERLGSNSRGRADEEEEEGERGPAGRQCGRLPRHITHTTLPGFDTRRSWLAAQRGNGGNGGNGEASRRPEVGGRKEQAPCRGGGQVVGGLLVTSVANPNPMPSRNVNQRSESRPDAIHHCRRSHQGRRVITRRSCKLPKGTGVLPDARNSPDGIPTASLHRRPRRLAPCDGGVVEEGKKRRSGK
ncbi:hypothetical protein BGZ61DRAFT_439530 [Ilyonectria robusta]|uniref:uncharacterized protein n=1 Tax=Ilyonectria robusta TaxID=1079257 RepID=UPI001E8DFEE9|nr:uncharacterized protein BGZ61DRAFT_439530 [Ilyonectria robusta]KAH8738063.1 hypothetical protein BGZ61DRAFT_439530 [Ilyonectria robusta]